MTALSDAVARRLAGIELQRADISDDVERVTNHVKGVEVITFNLFSSEKLQIGDLVYVAGEKNMAGELAGIIHTAPIDQLVCRRITLWRPL